jgi:protein required for attachment to host cells
MNIPNNFPMITNRILMVVCDTSHALFYELQNRDLEKIGEVAINYPPKEDIERTSIKTPSGMHSAEQSENLEMEKIHRFSVQLADELHSRLQKNEYKEIYFIAPQERSQQFLDAMCEEVRGLVTRTLQKQVTKESPLEILARLYKKTA